MSEEASATPAPQASANRPHINITPPGMEMLDLYKKELATYLRELPRLVQQGYAGKHALVKGDQVLSVWDTRGDAVQAGVERFGLEPLFVKAIDPRDVDRFTALKAQLGDSCPF